jgi:hypothetical protein
LVSVVAASYLLEVSTRRMEKLVETLSITRLLKAVGFEVPSLEREVARDSRGIRRGYGTATPWPKSARISGMIPDPSMRGR